MSTDRSVTAPPAEERQAAASPPPPPESYTGVGNALRNSAAAFVARSYLLLVLVAVGFAGTLLTPYFLTGNNLKQMLIGASIVSVLAIGQFLVIVTGGIDLSVGSIAALASVILGVALKGGMPFELALVLTLAAGSAAGAVNGVLVVYARITPFIATLAMLSIVSGIAYLAEGGDLVAVLSGSFLSLFNGEVATVPTPILITIGVLIVSSIVMAFAAFGRRLYAIGGNTEAARLSGLPVDRDRVVAYCASGFLAAVAGLMIAAQLTEGSARLGQGYELNAIAAVVVGGAALSGGTGDPVSAVLGGLIIAVIVNIMNLLGVQSEPQLIITGLVILAAVFFTSGRGTSLISSAMVGSRMVGRRLHLPINARSSTR
jgi:ribose transport system permease protein